VQERKEGVKKLGKKKIWFRILNEATGLDFI
jgi:hypothetical protein